MEENKWLKIINKILNENLGEAVQLIMGFDTCIVAEGKIYSSILMAPLISETLMGNPVRCYTPLEYSRYIAAYRDIDKMIILMDKGEKLTPQMKNLIDICRIMKVETIIILFSNIDGDIKRIITPKIIPLNLNIGEIELQNFIAAITIMIRLLAEASINKFGNQRAKDILKQLNDMEIDEVNEEKLREIIKDIRSCKVTCIFSDHMLMGMVKSVFEEEALKAHNKIGIHRIDDHPQVTSRILNMSGKTIILTSEVEEDAARQIYNYIKINGGEAEIYVEKGDPILAPLQLSINLFGAIKKI